MLHDAPAEEPAPPNTTTVATLFSYARQQAPAKGSSLNTSKGRSRLQLALRASYRHRMREIAIYYDDVWESIFGAMLFPDDPEMARHHVATFHLQSTPSIGNELRPETLERIRAERKNRQFDGDCVGEIVKMLLTLIHFHADKASWRSAVAHVSEYVRNNTGCGASPSLYTKRLSRLAPVLHLWGARACRFQCLQLDDRSVGYSREDDARCFITEAQKVLEYLHAWDAARGPTERSGYLAADAFGSWPGMRPYEPRPGWRTGEVQAFGPLSDNLLLRPDGRPVVKPRGWQKGRPRSSAE
jgi:hypothetical protein